MAKVFTSMSNSFENAVLLWRLRLGIFMHLLKSAAITGEWNIAIPTQQSTGPLSTIRESIHRELLVSTTFAFFISMDIALVILPEKYRHLGVGISRSI